jgi:hypothetical protein
VVFQSEPQMQEAELGMAKEKNNRTHPEGTAFNGVHRTHRRRIDAGMTGPAGRAGERAKYPVDRP